MTNANKPAVYFDGSCPLCRAEIGLYRRQAGADGIDWVDVAACQAKGEAPAADLSAQTAMARFHMRTANGQLVHGAHAFATLWRHLPRWAWAGRIALVPPVRLALEGLYRLFLPLRPRIQAWIRRSKP